MVTLAESQIVLQEEFPREFSRMRRRARLAWKLVNFPGDICDLDQCSPAPLPPENPNPENLYNYIFGADWVSSCRLITGLAELEAQMLETSQAQRNRENAALLVVGKKYLTTSPILACGFPAVGVIETPPKNMHFSKVRYLGSHNGHNFFDGVPDNDPRPITRGSEFLGRCYFSILLTGGPVLVPST